MEKTVETENLIKNGHFLNILLSNTCPMKCIDEEQKIQEFWIEVHCVVFTIVAKSLGWNEELKVGEFEIISWGMEPN